MNVAARRISRPKFVPDTFVSRTTEGIVLWCAPCEPTCNVDALATVVTSARSRVSELLGFVATRPLHVCMYHLLTVMRNALDRTVLGTMLLVPHMGPDASLIVCASPRVDAQNGDRDRMLRHIAHEITHCFVAEVSGSTKELGDGNEGRRVPAWLDEGLAELVSLAVSGREDGAASHVPAVVPGWNEYDVNARLEALDALDRPLAFAWATERVRSMAARVGIAPLFASLSPEAGP